MGQKILVGPDIEGGREFLQLLKEHDIDVTAALWQYDRLSDDWDLVISSPLADKIGVREIYKKMWSILNRINRPPIDLQRVSLFYNRAPFIKSLRRNWRKMREIQVRRQPVGDHMVDDGYVYFVK